MIIINKKKCVEKASVAFSVEYKEQKINALQDFIKIRLNKRKYTISNCNAEAE